MPNSGKAAPKNSTATASEDQPKRSDEFSKIFIHNALFVVIDVLFA